jgi:predicted HTH domain antitoxin
MKRAKKRPLPSEMQRSVAIEIFREHKVSLGKAAKLAGLTKIDFIGLLGAQGIPAVDYPASELEDELVLLGSPDRKKCKLADLMAQIPPGTKFEELDCGPPVGREIL